MNKQGNTHYKVSVQKLTENQSLTAFTQHALQLNYYFITFQDIKNQQLAKLY